jgi:hypothetical protein
MYRACWYAPDGEGYGIVSERRAKLVFLEGVYAVFTMLTTSSSASILYDAAGAPRGFGEDRVDYSRILRGSTYDGSLTVPWFSPSSAMHQGCCASVIYPQFGVGLENSLGSIESFLRAEVPIAAC